MILQYGWTIHSFIHSFVYQGGLSDVSEDGLNDSSESTLNGVSGSELMVHQRMH